MPLSFSEAASSSSCAGADVGTRLLGVGLEATYRGFLRTGDRFSLRQ